jgi:type I thyroxine 5'-deiodinase
MRSNVRDGVLFKSASSYAERAETASICMRKLGIKFPALIDEISNKTEEAYTGWPDRLYLIDLNGRVVYKSKPGPFGFKPDELEGALKQLTTPTNVAQAAQASTK